MRVCGRPGCPTLSTTPYCPQHTIPAWTGSNRRAELPHNWAQTRRRILARDRHRCQWPGCTTTATEVDHIGDRNDHRAGNLRALCTPHHTARTQAQAQAARNGTPTYGH